MAYSFLRVEHKKYIARKYPSGEAVKIGPYVKYSNKRVKKMVDRHTNLELRPTPRKDKGIDRTLEAGEFCGFRNVKQLKRWFTKEELKTLKDNSFVIKRYSTYDFEITAIGERQILFKRRT